MKVFDAKIPRLDLLHPYLVDENGISDFGLPRPGLFAAREPLPYDIDSRFHADNRFDSDTGEEIDRTQGLQTLNDAVHDFSQTDIGCDLLSAALRAGIKIRLDRKGCDAIKSGGYYSSKENAVVLNQDQQRAYMTLALVHELEHAMHDHPDLNGTSNDSLSALIYKSRIKEAAARAVVGVFVYQAKYINKNGPLYYQPQNLQEAFERDDPVLAEAAKKFSKLAKKGNWQAFGRELFKASLKDLDRLAGYDQRQIDYANEVMAQYDERLAKYGFETFRNDANPNLLSGNAPSSQQLVQPLQILGKPYVTPSMVEDSAFKQLMPMKPVVQAQRALVNRANVLNAVGFAMNVNVPQAGLSLRVKIGTGELVDQANQTLERAGSFGNKVYESKIGKMAFYLGSTILIAGLAKMDISKGLLLIQKNSADQAHAQQISQTMQNLRTNALNEKSDYAKHRRVRTERDLRLVVSYNQQLWQNASDGDEASLKEASTILRTIKESEKLSKPASKSLVAEISHNDTVIQHLASQQRQDGSILTRAFKPVLFRAFSLVGDSKGIPKGFRM